VSPLVKASAYVGAVGALFALPLLLALFVPTRGFRNLDFFAPAPFIIATIGAISFATAIRLLPESPRKCRVAGIIAGMSTFLLFELWLWHSMNFDTGGRAWPFGIFPVVGGLLTFGWVAFLAGWVAGRGAERYIGAPSNNTLQRTRDGSFGEV
jgi:hypothetical protein